MEPPLKAVTLDVEELSATDIAFLLGIRYEAVLRYAKELEASGLLRLVRAGRNRLVFTRADLEVLRGHHLQRKREALGDGIFELHQQVLRELKIQHNHLTAMSRKVGGLVSKIKACPPSTSTLIQGVPLEGARLKTAIPVFVEPLGGNYFKASAADLGVEATAQGGRAVAVRALRQRIAAEFVYLRQLKQRSPKEEERYQELERFIEVRPEPVEGSR